MASPPPPNCTHWAFVARAPAGIIATTEEAIGGHAGVWPYTYLGAPGGHNAQPPLDGAGVQEGAQPPPPPHPAVKQGKSGGSFGTTYQGKGKGNGKGKIGSGGRGRTQGGERPMGATAYGEKGSKGRTVSGDRLIGSPAADQNTPRCNTNAPPPPPGTASQGWTGPRRAAPECLQFWMPFFHH